MPQLLVFICAVKIHVIVRFYYLNRIIYFAYNHYSFKKFYAKQ